MADGASQLFNAAEPQTDAASVDDVAASLPPNPTITQALQHYWGFDTLRPLQGEAVDASLAHRDSLVVMPTGGGKSLCYQLPPVVADRTDIVVSPLISLMQDQVDGLRACGYPAAALHSGIDPAERQRLERDVFQGKYRLIFAAPERVLTPWFMQVATRLNVKSFAIDEAHCISQWGHDFRPEYRQMATLRDRFPDASLHAFTATATPQVQQDIVEQLQLRDPLQLIGTFDRPNLTYRVLPKDKAVRQIIEVLRRHEGQASIVYCISRNDTERTAAKLRDAGIDARHYHAGMSPEQRQRTQEDFSRERLNVVVATVAFGMGIDRSDVRCVIHQSMPKSIEGYQQETGRAGRDGLEAECVLLYSTADAIRWEGLVERSAENAGEPAQVIEAQKALLRGMQRVCSTPVCRHKTLSEYFGQSYDKENCGACDVCLGEVEGYEDATVPAQMILSAVARTEQRFGITHVVDVLCGANTDMVRRCGHDELSTYGLMRDQEKKTVKAMVYQLLERDLLSRTPGDRPTLFLNDQSVRVMRGELAVELLKPRKGKGRELHRSTAEEDGWDGVDRELFDKLRAWRKATAEERGVPPYVIFHDRTLRDIARAKPTDEQTLGTVRGIGERKLAEYGAAIVELVVGLTPDDG